MHRIILAVLVTSAALAGGCAGGVYYADGGGTLTATTVAPDLVTVGPGVDVVADYDYPVFYSDNFYWRYDNGLWYRSNWYTGGWVYATPPSAILRIDRPYAYRHYRPAGWVARGSYRAPAYRESRPVYREPAVREHRVYRGEYRAPNREYRGEYRAPAPAPAVRDHRAPPSNHRERHPVVRDHR